MAEYIRNGNRAIGVETRLVTDCIGDGHRAVPWVTPVSLFLAAEHVFQGLVNPRAGINRNGSAKQIESGLNNGQRAPPSRVWVVNAACAHIKRENVAGSPAQNVPEGAVVSIPMRAAGKSRTRSFLMGCLSGIAQPLGAILVLLLAAMFVPMLPYMLAFAAGAMLYVVVEELIPEASSGTHTNLSTILFAIGFALMMVLDVALG